MEGLNNINQVIQYIEANLDQKLDLKVAAQKAYLSEYQLSRLFTQLFGISISEYIRRRRLTLAAYEIQNTRIRVLDLALKYGYESADAFSRAFKKLHNVTPTEAKKAGAQVVAFPKLSVAIDIKGESEIHYRIESTHSEIEVIGQSFKISMARATEEIPNIWNVLNRSGQLEILANQRDASVKILGGLLGIYSDEGDLLDGEYRYFIGARKHGEMTHSFKSFCIKSGRWLVFTDISEARRKLFSEWIPTLGYTLDQRPFIECIFGPFSTSKDELWVPIK
ncbi:AraC family transcriptional regulator [Fusibacter ferrireducens]|uniref:AraC family transcriptional regulator n=1 Tax=Fusibacter ferrireducens TaxID=2785058 RepID=A0ABR9ZYQ0_9FIRM|nr:AraC family transcriptional regulator [Fusibacter ferrireducens]MBF4695590.1 AraC family transcriptional regulator [Fusibacter ferrireducens]